MYLVKLCANALIVLAIWPEAGSADVLFSAKMRGNAAKLLDGSIEVSGWSFDETDPKKPSTVRGL